MELPIIVSVGEPKRNKDYHAAISPKRTTDNTESLAMVRFALVEQPPATPDVPQAFILLREIAARLHGQIKDKTRAINRLHNLVSRVFPELATIAPNLDAAWVLDLLDHYSSPKRIAAARLDSLKKIAYLWNAAKSAIVHNPPVRELYKRLCDRGIRGDIALGHCMQKLLHQVFAVWSTDRPFDPDYRSKRAPQTMSVVAGKEVHSTMKLADSDSGNVIDCTSAKTETTAAHNPDLSPDQSVVTTVASQLEPVGNSCTIQTPNVTPGTHQCAIDFSFVREWSLSHLL